MSWEKIYKYDEGSGETSFQYGYRTLDGLSVAPIGAVKRATWAGPSESITNRLIGHSCAEREQHYKGLVESGGAFVDYECTPEPEAANQSENLPTEVGEYLSYEQPFFKCLKHIRGVDFLALQSQRCSLLDWARERGRERVEEQGGPLALLELAGYTLPGVMDVEPLKPNGNPGSGQAAVIPNLVDSLEEFLAVVKKGDPRYQEAKTFRGFSSRPVTVEEGTMIAEHGQIGFAPTYRVKPPAFMLKQQESRTAEFIRKGLGL